MRIWLFLLLCALLFLLIREITPMQPAHPQPVHPQPVHRQPVHHQRTNMIPPQQQSQSTLPECLEKLPDPEHEFYNLFSEYHNCYAYAFQDRNINFTSKPQPGYKAGKPALRQRDYTCKNFQDAIKADYPDTVQEEIGCPCGYSRVFLALDTEGNFQDYHFYRQDENGLWSHKPGSMPVQHRDYSGKRIYNPFDADRHDHENRDIHYNIPCGFMCVKRQ